MNKTQLNKRVENRPIIEKDVDTFRRITERATNKQLLEMIGKIADDLHFRLRIGRHDEDE